MLMQEKKQALAECKFKNYEILTKSEPQKPTKSGQFWDILVLYYVRCARLRKLELLMTPTISV
jgi:hypothetical protein